MSERFTREYPTLSYHPQTPLTDEALRDLVRLIEGYLQRQEQRIEVLQDAVSAVEGRSTALETRMTSLEARVTALE